jgi:hypothetical protein
MNLVKCKQWLLAGEFSEFEYSPEIGHFWQIRVLAKMVFLKNWSDSLNSPSFANLVCSDSQDSPTFANLISGTHQTCKSQVLQVISEFGKFGEFGEFSECRLDRFIHIKYVMCA